MQSQIGEDFKNLTQYIYIQLISNSLFLHSPFNQQNNNTIRSMQNENVDERE